MNIKSLRMLTALAENNCDFGIHRQLGIPRSTLWAHINDLERDTGIKFILRKKQNNILTEEGLNFLPYARNIIKIFDEGLAKTEPLESDKMSGELMIATTTSMASSWLMPCLNSFKAAYPNIHLKIVADDYISATTERMADVIFRPIDSKDFLLRHWSLSYAMGLWAHPSYLSHYPPLCKPEDLLCHQVIGYGNHIFSYFQDVDWHLKGRWGDLPRICPYITINSTYAIYLAAQKGLGICSAAHISNLFLKGNLERILPEIDGPLISVYFCSKRDVSSKTEKNVHLLSGYFSTFLETIGVATKHEPE